MDPQTHRVSFDIKDMLDWRRSARTTLRQEVTERAWQALPDRFSDSSESEISIDGQYVDVTFKEAS